MKVVLIPLLWILFALLLKDVQGDSTILNVLSRCKRNHEPSEEIVNENILCNDLNEDDPAKATNNDIKDTKSAVNTISNDSPPKVICKCRKNKKIKIKNLDSKVTNRNDEKSCDETPKTIELGGSQVEDQHDDPAKTNVLHKTECNIQEKTCKEVEIIPTKRSEKEKNLTIKDVKAELDAMTLKNDDNKEIDKNNVKINCLKSSLDETQQNAKKNQSNETIVSTINYYPTKESLLPTNTIEAKELNQNKVAVESINIPENHEENGFDCEIKRESAIEQLENTNPRFTTTLKPKIFAKVINDVTFKKELEEKINSPPCSKNNAESPIQSENKNVQSTICTSRADKHDCNILDHNSLGNESQGPTVCYEVENVQHYIRRYCVRPNLSNPYKNNPTNCPLNKSQNTYTFYKTPNKGFVNEYQVEDANGHKIAFTKCTEDDRIELNANQNSNNKNKWRPSSQYQTTKTCNGYLSNNIHDDNCFRYITSPNIQNQVNDNVYQNVYYADPYIQNGNRIHNVDSPNECKIKINNNEVIQLNDNYIKTNRRETKIPNGYIINEILNRKICQDTSSGNFHGIEKETWKYWGNKKIVTSHCNQHKM